MTSEKHLAPSTIRSYQCDVRLFSEFLIDGRYGWGPACEEAFGTFPVAVCHEWNTIAHLNDYEGDPEAKPFTREQLQLFLDYADDQVDRAVRAKRKGALAAYRDATLFKVIYGWGLRRTETSKLDLVDFGRNPQARQFGRYGTLNVRYGKAKKGQPPRRRNVLSVMDWAVDAVADYVENVRPRFGFPDHPALWITNGWGTPRQHINWTHYIFYGADIRESALDWFMNQLREIARIPASDDDGDLIRGLFLASHEVDGAAEWQIREGQLFVSSADARHQYLDE
ncbi:hypothetical protein ACFWFF_34505 [Streptomyces sp. NPDC060223]|uniref:hypothetical protein n=1 Tax=Streptomyces sp. NPDC060223 TaxID=3347077 RepID=UPI00364DA037